jgi:hypothetical protein
MALNVEKKKKKKREREGERLTMGFVRPAANAELKKELPSS